MIQVAKNHKEQTAGVPNNYNTPTGAANPSRGFWDTGLSSLNPDTERLASILFRPYYFATLGSNAGSENPVSVFGAFHTTPFHKSATFDVNHVYRWSHRLASNKCGRLESNLQKPLQRLTGIQYRRVFQFRHARENKAPRVLWADKFPAGLFCG